jgi:hypothetical protein
LEVHSRRRAEARFQSKPPAIHGITSANAPPVTMLTDYHAKLIAHDLTRRCPSDSVEKLTAVLSDAQVDLNPHQIDAALFAFSNPQRFMDAVAGILKHELHRLLVDGIKYEKIDGAGAEAEWEMLLFKNEELINYLTALQVNKSVYEYVVYDSEIEREFAKRLDTRTDIRLFVKLPSWFEIDTPVGKYNPDWAIVKHNDATLYLVRETKGTKDFLKLRTAEADKVRCGAKHFETLGVPFSVVLSADEV